MNPWDDDENFPPADWQEEVANGDTRLGYVEWVQQQRDEAESEPSSREMEAL